MFLFLRVLYSTKVEVELQQQLPSSRIVCNKCRLENRKWKSDPPKGNKTDFYRIYIRVRGRRKTFVKDFLDRLSLKKGAKKC